MKLSFIIPVYNTDINYLKRCLSSICAENFCDSEIIIVNDGSNEEITAFVRRYVSQIQANTKLQIILIEKTNTGVSDSRNVGLKAARGKWIWFVDSDDYILDGAKDVLCEVLQTDCQAIALSFMQEINTNEAYPYLATCELSEGIHSGRSLLNIKSTSPTVWSFLFRRDIIVKNKLLMSTNLKFGEDKIFILEYLSYVQNVLVLPTPVYRYVFCETSAVRQNYMRNEREIDDQLKSILVLLRNCKQINIDNRIYKSQILYIVTQFILLCSTSEIGYTQCKMKFSTFLVDANKLGYSSLLLRLISLGLRYFYLHPYLLKRRFLYSYFAFNRMRYGF